MSRLSFELQRGEGVPSCRGSNTWNAAAHTAAPLTECLPRAPYSARNAVVIFSCFKGESLAPHLRVAALPSVTCAYDALLMPDPGALPALAAAADTLTYIQNELPEGLNSRTMHPGMSMKQRGEALDVSELRLHFARTNPRSTRERLSSLSQRG